MARVKVWFGGKLCGSFDDQADVLESAETEIPIDSAGIETPRSSGKISPTYDKVDFLQMQSPDKPLEMELLHFGQLDTRQESVSVRLCRLQDGRLVLLESEFHRADLRPRLVDSEIAAKWFRSHDQPIPAFLAGVRSPTLAASRPDESREVESPFAQREIDALVVISESFRLLARETYGFEYREEFPVAMAALARFAFAVTRDTIKLASRVPCGSAELLAIAASQAVGECELIGIDDFAYRLRDDSFYDEVKGWRFSKIYEVVANAYRPKTEADETPDESKESAERIRRRFVWHDRESDQVTAILGAARVLQKLARVASIADLTDVPFPPISSRTVTTDEPDSTSGLGHTSECEFTSGSTPSQPVLDSDGMQQGLPNIDDVADSVPVKRRTAAFFRDYSWYCWSVQKQLSPHQIRDEWNSLSATQRTELARSERFSNEVSWDTVKKGLLQAEENLRSFRRSRAETSELAEDSDVSEHLSD